MPYRTSPQLSLNLDDHPLIIDSFAGGGGASTGLEAALGRPVDVAINHNPIALGVHLTNHFQSLHLSESVFDIDPKQVCGERRVLAAWFSPDCTHFSRAKGGKPVKKEIRGLAWVVLRWAATVRPSAIFLENVCEFASWGPIKNGQPCKKRKGQTFERWKSQLEALGYQIEYRILNAADYGAATARERLFLVARCDGRPIAWPEPTHGPGRPRPYRTAAEVIDWSIPCPSIFGRKKPLVEATMRRIARGIQKFVLDSNEPFIAPISPVTLPFISTYYGAKDKNGEPRGCAMNGQIGTQTTENRHALVSMFLAKHFGGNYCGSGISLKEPLATITARDHHALVCSHLIKMRGSCRHGQALTQPLSTITAGGTHLGEVRTYFAKYMGQDMEPIISIQGQPYFVSDIGMRMLQPPELLAAQGFPSNYIIDRLHDGTPVSKTAQIKLIGNSVCPPVAEALVRANLVDQPAAIIPEASAA